MSGILAVVTEGNVLPDEQLLTRLLAEMRTRGEAARSTWSREGCGLGVCRNGWELTEDFSGGQLAVVEDELVIVADATLYYREELLRALASRGIRPRGETPAQLIVAAYRAWGAECARHLDGDFAFLLWDAERRQLVAARDFGGTRPLFYAQLGDALVVASTLGACLAHPRCPRDLNLAALGEAAAGFFAASHETCYQAIQRLPAGSTLLWRAGAVSVARHWEPPRIGDAGGPSFVAAAEELRALLKRAVAERVARSGATSVWLSGGWDSTAIFAAGERLRADRGSGEQLRPVSISYPPGDPGREDELIEQVAAHWKAPVHWLDIADIPILDEVSAAARRDEPFAHVFENWNRALARGSRAAETRVALQGVGGDQLFQVSRVYLADLLLRGRWPALAKEWRSSRPLGSGYRSFLYWAVQPLLPPPLLRAAALLRGGKPLQGYLERPLPQWIEPDFARRYGLREREQRFTPARQGMRHADYEMHWYLAHPYAERILSSVFSFGLEEGVEMRMPLYDRRVIDFAARRPRWERASGTQTKHLLRRAMRGLLPDAVLAPRGVRTGLTSGYLLDGLRRLFSALPPELRMATTLATCGIINAVLLEDSFRRFLHHQDESLGVTLYFTLQTELWLRGQLHTPTAASVAPGWNPSLQVNRSEWFEQAH